MATVVKNPQAAHSVKKGGQTPQMPPLTPGQRRWKRFLYQVKHPGNAIWGWLSSVRNAIYLIALIVIICFIGISFVQAPAEVLGDPVAYAIWMQQNAVPRYGSLTPVYDWLQFFTVFSSWYFDLVMTILCLSIVVCTLNRAPAIWQNFSHPLLRRSEKFYRNALERGEFERSDAVNWTTAALRKRHYRVRSVVETHKKGDVEEETSEVVYLYANKNSWATLSTFVFHASLVTLLMAGVLSQWHGFAATSPARHYLPAPLISLSDAMAGFNFDQALANGQSTIVYPRGTLHNISFRNNHFTAKFDPQTGLATDYVTDLSVYRDGVEVAHSDHLRVNDPLSYGGVIFHQSSLIPSVDITVRDRGGVVFSGPLVLDQTSNSGGVAFDYGDVAISDSSNLVLRVAYLHDSTQHISQQTDPRLLVRIGDPNTSLKQSNFLSFLHPGSSAQSADKTWTVKLNSASDATVLLVTKDNGSFIIWPTAVILILSLCLTFYFPQRRLWLRIEGNRVQMGALREHFVNIRTDLLGIAREAQRDSKGRLPEPLMVANKQ